MTNKEAYELVRADWKPGRHLIDLFLYQHNRKYMRLIRKCIQHETKLERMAGRRIPLDQFDPYGTGAGTPDILSWSWLNWMQAADGPRECLAGFANGKWTFYKTETDFF